MSKGNKMTFEEVEKICKEKADGAGIKLVLNSKELVDCFGKNQAVQSDGEIILGEYDSPELMALCFAHEMSHVFTKSDLRESKFEYEWCVWGRTFDTLFGMFNIHATKELAEHALNCLKSYAKEEHLLHG